MSIKDRIMSLMVAHPKLITLGITLTIVGILYSFGTVDHSALAERISHTTCSVNNQPVYCGGP